MIVECVKVKIDTDEDHKGHKLSIEKTTDFYCEEDKPIYWFVQRVDNRKRFFHLHYNKSGTELKEITSWDEADDRYKKVRRLKDGGEKMCYFMRQEVKDPEYEWVKEKDYGGPVSQNPITHWKKGWSEPAYQANPIEKKPWWKFF